MFTSQTSCVSYTARDSQWGHRSVDSDHVLGGIFFECLLESATDTWVLWFPVCPHACLTPLVSQGWCGAVAVHHRASQSVHSWVSVVCYVILLPVCLCWPGQDLWFFCRDADLHQRKLWPRVQPKSPCCHGHAGRDLSVCVLVWIAHSLCQHWVSAAAAHRQTDRWTGRQTGGLTGAAVRRNQL